jgi:hypothetical protein
VGLKNVWSKSPGLAKARDGPDTKATTTTDPISNREAFE